MKPTLSRICLFVSTVAFAAIAPPGLAQQRDKVKIKEDKVKIKDEEGKVKIKGEDAGQAVVEEGPDIFAGFGVGTVIPREQRRYLVRVPDEYMVRIQPPAQDVIARFYRGRVYYLDQDTYRIVDIVTF